MKLIFITSCKPLNNEDITIMQKNSIRSWSRLPIDKKILVFNKNQSVIDMCEDLDVEVVSDYDHSSYSDIPTWVSMKNIASEHAENGDVIVWVNSDVMFDETLLNTINTVNESINDFVLVGQKYDWHNFTLLDTIPNFNLFENLSVHSEWAIDYFIFKKHVFLDVPKFFIARMRFDNFLMDKAIKEHTAIDCSETIFCIHHRHDYGPNTDKKFSDIYETSSYQTEQKINDSLINGSLSNIKNCMYYTKFENNEIKILKK